MNTQLIIADDHPLFRSAMKQAVGSMLGGEIFEAQDFESCLATLREQSMVELVLLDLNMPGNKGLTGLSYLRTTFPSVQIIIVSAVDDAEVIRRAIDFGASGYIPKSASLDVIQQAINKVLDGEMWLPQELASRIEGKSRADDVDFAARLEQLTPQQFRVLSMVADGLLNKQIAYEMNVQETTIKQHVSAILKKLGVINRLQAGILFKQRLDLTDNVSALES